MAQPKRIFTALTLALALAACAPRTQTSERAPPTRLPQTSPAPGRTPGTPDGGVALTDPAALEVDRAARQAFHLMGLEFTRTGAYSVNVLVSDLELPSGARWELENLAADTYALRFTSDNVPEIAWRVTPEGVESQQVDTNQIL